MAKDSFGDSSTTRLALAAETRRSKNLSEVSHWLGIPWRRSNTSARSHGLGFIGSSSITTTNVEVLCPCSVVTLFMFLIELSYTDQIKYLSFVKESRGMDISNCGHQDSRRDFLSCLLFKLVDESHTAIVGLGPQYLDTLRIFIGKRRASIINVDTKSGLTGMRVALIPQRTPLKGCSKAR
jgi:hypothetical protein